MIWHKNNVIKTKEPTFNYTINQHQAKPAHPNFTNKKHLLQYAKGVMNSLVIYRAPVFDNCDPSGSSERQLRVGTPSAQERNCLWLLPSGPDQVHRCSLRRTHPSTLRSDTCLTSTIPRTGIQSRYSGLRVIGHRYLPI